MALSKRRQIVTLIANKIKEIDGLVSPYDPEFTYEVNIKQKAKIEERILFLDEINVFPHISVSAGYETINDLPPFSNLEVNIRIHVKEVNSYDILDRMYEDIEHMLNHIVSIENELGIMRITIASYDTDKGLMDPFGLGIIDLNIEYELI